MKSSLADWLQSRQPAAPDALLARMLAEARELGSARESVDPEKLADAGASILRKLDATGCTDRSAALDLLAADALFTYAIEAAAEDNSRIEEAAAYVLKLVTK